LENSDYTNFAETCIDKLKELQEKFQHDHDLEWYTDWFYNQLTGLLTFSNGDVELNFRYFYVGSFSEETKTWKWSWDNDSTLESVKKQTNIVKEFGARSGFPKLTTGSFPSDEYEAWEFAAIAVHLTGGIGVYRPVNEKQLQIFLVITELVDNDTAKNIKEKFVHCDLHEYRRIAFVCKHLDHTNKVGFQEAFKSFENMELPEEEDLQAWCEECEQVRQREGGWNDRSMEFAGIKIVCEKCYFEMKELNLGHR
jgi:hypothetical protein